MKKFLSILGLTLILASCGGQTLVYTVAVHDTEPAKTQELMQAIQRVMNRRLAAVEVTESQVTAVPTGPMSGTLTLVLPDSESVEKVQSILDETFTFDLRIEKPNADPLSTEPSEWIPTALTGSSLQWVQAIGNTATNEISIDLAFTPAGQAILASVFSNNAGQHVGIFVRDLLVSKLQIASNAPADHVIIGGIPSAKVAEIFADDVNTGLHLTFTPAS